MGRFCTYRQVVIYITFVMTTVLFIRTVPRPEAIPPVACGNRPTIPIPPQPLHANPLVDPDDYDHHFTVRKSRVTPLDFDIVASGKGLCNSTAQELDMVILVVSEPGHLPLRNMIRETWGANKKIQVGNKVWTVQLIFLFGLQMDEKTNQELKQETKTYNDILIFDFHDTYFNLTYKVLHGFKWVQNHCSHVKYVLKVDDDTYLNLPGIFQRLESKEWNTKICGLFSQSEPVNRDNYKSKVSFKSYPFENYPPHVKGRAYFMPAHIAGKLMTVAEYMPYLNMEDVHVTGVLARAAGDVHHHGYHEKEYHPFQAAEHCEILGGKILVSSITVESGYTVWRELQEGGPHKPCPVT